MNSPENPYRQMDETVVNTKSVKESLDILQDQLLHVATLQAIESYIINRKKYIKCEDRLRVHETFYHV